MNNPNVKTTEPINFLDVDLSCLNACFNNSPVSNAKSDLSNNQLLDNVSSSEGYTNNFQSFHSHDNQQNDQYNTLMNTSYLFSPNSNFSSTYSMSSDYNNNNFSENSIKVSTDDDQNLSLENVDLLSNHHIADLDIFKEDDSLNVNCNFKEPMNTETRIPPVASLLSTEPVSNQQQLYLILYPLLSSNNNSSPQIQPATSSQEIIAFDNSNSETLNEPYYEKNVKKNVLKRQRGSVSNSLKVTPSVALFDSKQQQKQCNLPYYADANETNNFFLSNSNNENSITLEKDYHLEDQNTAICLSGSLPISSNPNNYDANYLTDEHFHILESASLRETNVNTDNNITQNLDLNLDNVLINSNNPVRETNENITNYSNIYTESEFQFEDFNLDMSSPLDIDPVLDLQQTKLPTESGLHVQSINLIKTSLDSSSTNESNKKKHYNRKTPARLPKKSNAKANHQAQINPTQIQPLILLSCNQNTTYDINQMNQISRSRRNSHPELTFNIQKSILSKPSITHNYKKCDTNENNKIDDDIYNAGSNNTNSYNYHTTKIINRNSLPNNIYPNANHKTVNVTSKAKKTHRQLTKKIASVSESQDGNTPNLTNYLLEKKNNNINNNNSNNINYNTNYILDNNNMEINNCNNIYNLKNKNFINEFAINENGNFNGTNNNIMLSTSSCSTSSGISSLASSNLDESNFLGIDAISDFLSKSENCSELFEDLPDLEDLMSLVTFDKNVSSNSSSSFSQIKESEFNSLYGNPSSESHDYGIDMDSLMMMDQGPVSNDPYVDLNNLNNVKRGSRSAPPSPTPTRKKPRTTGNRLPWNKNWSKMNENERSKILQNLTRVINDEMDLEEQLEIIRILNPNPILKPTDTQYIIDLKMIDDEKYKRIKEIIKAFGLSLKAKQIKNNNTNEYNPNNCPLVKRDLKSKRTQQGLKLPRQQKYVNQQTSKEAKSNHYVENEVSPYKSFQLEKDAHNDLLS